LHLPEVNDLASSQRSRERHVGARADHVIGLPTSLLDQKWQLGRRLIAEDHPAHSRKAQYHDYTEQQTDQQ
jgi:hypothetical protein